MQLGGNQLVEHITLARGIHHRHQLVQSCPRTLAHADIEKHLTTCAETRGASAFGRRTRCLRRSTSWVFLRSLWHMSVSVGIRRREYAACCGFLSTCA
jgi:hypothetical protein